MRINVMQIKIKTTVYYFNNIYNRMEEIREEKWESWGNEKKNKKENERKKMISFLHKPFFYKGWKV